MISKSKILIIDDEENIRELLSYNLKNNGYDTFCCDNGIDAVNMAKKILPDLILLDIMLPGIDGYDVCKRIRGDKIIFSTPIIMLTAKHHEFNKILGLEIGADDYISKPFSIKDILARVKALLRRNNLSKSNIIVNYGNLEADFTKYEVKVKGKTIDLTITEFKLLELLILNNGNVVTREELLREIWQYEFSVETRLVDAHIRNLRKKIEVLDERKYIHTIRGVGYKFSVGQ